VASVSLSYGGGGGEEEEYFLSCLIEELCLSKAVVDRKALCIVPGELVWVTHVDVMVLNAGGSLIDAISFGVKAALNNTVLPAIQILPGSESEHADFEIDDRPETGIPFPADNIPVCVTVGQITGRFVWDMSLEEELCADSKLTVAVGRSGECCGIHKSGNLPIEMAALPSVTQNTRQAGLVLHQKMDKVLADEI